MIDAGLRQWGGEQTDFYAEFTEKFKGRFTDEQIQSLVAWHRGQGRG